MKKIGFLLLVIFAWQNSALAQQSVAIGGTVGYYQPSLDVIDEFLTEAQANGATISRTSGNVIFGGTFDFSITPRVRLRLDVSKWQDTARWESQEMGTPTQSEIAVDVLPVIAGFQFYLREVERVLQYYLGASVGVVHTSIDIRNNSQTPGAPGTTNSLSSSGNEFAFRPFAGVDLRIAQSVKIFSEANYYVGKFTPQDIDFLRSRRGRESLSLNGFSFLGGLKFLF